MIKMPKLRLSYCLHFIHSHTATEIDARINFIALCLSKSVLFNLLASKNFRHITNSENAMECYFTSLEKGSQSGLLAQDLLSVGFGKSKAAL